MFHTIISASLSPNTELDDVVLAVKTILFPWNWKRGNALSAVRIWFEKRYPHTDVTLFNSGRSALLALLRGFNIQDGDEVLVQSFSCVAVANSVLWTRGTPVYVDIDETLNMRLSDIEKKLSPRTKAIILQHTFGIPSDIRKILILAKKHNLIVIEDCAHGLGSSCDGKPLGSWGDAAFFSFGRDKVVSSIWGGAAVVQDVHPGVQKKVKAFHDMLPYPSFMWIVQQLFHPVFFSIAIPLYRLYLGKGLIALLRALQFISLPVYPEEKHGGKPEEFPKRYPNALAQLVVHQLSKLSAYSDMRQRSTSYYRSHIPKEFGRMFPSVAGEVHLRFPVWVKNPLFVQKKAKAQGVLLGNWYSNGIDPKGVSFTDIGYDPKTCPQAHEIGRHIINLPTRISLAQAALVVRSLL
jgi:dTDP-4-amino-4,6-dideoxygalactose transaminase